MFGTKSRNKLKKKKINKNCSGKLQIIYNNSEPAKQDQKLLKSSILDYLKISVQRN